MNFKRSLVPSFLQQLDRELLLRNPGVWSARMHLVLWYGILFAAALALLSYFDRTDLRAPSSTEYWVGFTIMISIVGVVGWLIYLLRFNIFKRYGNVNAFYMPVSFLLYFVCTGVFVSLAYVHPAVETMRTNKHYPDAQFVSDINTINLGIARLESKLLNQPWRHDTIVLDNVKGSAAYYYADEVTVEASTGDRRPSRLLLDSSAFRQRLEDADSSRRINESLSVVYQTPTFALVDVYVPDARGGKLLMSSMDVYRKIQAEPRLSTDQENIRRNLLSLIRKYDHEDRPVTYTRAVTEPNSIVSQLKHKYETDVVNRTVSNIARKKYRWTEHQGSGALRVFYYFTMLSALLVFIFRQTTTKTFFLTLLTGVLLMILTAMIMSFGSRGEGDFFNWMIAYYLIFLAGSATAWATKTRNVFTGIATNLVIFLTPLFPLILVSRLHVRDYSTAEQMYPTPEETAMISRHLLYAEIAGPAFLLILMGTYFYRVARRWYALPVL